MSSIMSASTIAAGGLAARTSAANASSYSAPLAIACSKMVGFEVSPVTSPARTMRASFPERSRSRVMKSIHGD
jgi:hypothetical protein